MYNFEALNDKDRMSMLQSIGVKSVDELFDSIPKSALMTSFDLDEGKDEMSAQKDLEKISKQNKTNYLYFLAGGAKKRYIPPVIYDVASRFEFLSSYTPYQAEISQGTLEAMYEFQSVMTTLTNQDVSNASVYDGACASAEAILMTSRITKNNIVLIDEDINSNYLEVIKTYLWAQGVEITYDKNTNEQNLCAKIYQTPNKYGEFVPMPSKNNKELIIAIVDLVSLGLFEPPKSDITVGDIQSLGLNLNFGGAYGGFIACKDMYKRQLSGRIAGKTVDNRGNTAYCLTLQAREQHIRREKATSNICSNQALCAFIANLYLRKTGKTNFRKIAKMSYDNAHNLAQKLGELGFELKNKDFFDDFTINVGNSEKFLLFMKEKGILAGTKLDNSNILVGVSELNDEEEIEKYVQCAKSLSLIRI